MLYIFYAVGRIKAVGRLVCVGASQREPEKSHIAKE